MDVELVPLNIGIAVPEEELQLQVFPNPSNGIVYAVSPVPDGSPVLIRCFNSLGNIVFGKDFSSSAEPLQIDLSGVDPGLYLVQLSGEKGTFTQRVVIR